MLPTPYYQDHACTIYHGDCREILPLLPKVDLVLTDPPYGIGEHGGKCRTRGCRVPNHKNQGWDMQRPAHDVFESILRAAPVHIVWGGNYFADFLPVSRGWLYWQKLMGGDFADGELAWTSIDMVLKEFTKANKGQKAQHPTQKPVELMTWCLSFAPDAQTILDPFMGSGTTLRAVKDLGRKAIGIEINRHYCDIAVERLRQEVLGIG